MNQPQPDGKVKDYCARTCCTAALHAALEIKERYPGRHDHDFYQDIRTYGRGHEEYYERASEQGVLFVRYNPRTRRGSSRTRAAHGRSSCGRRTC